jgi:hypothetical protein
MSVSRQQILNKNRWPLLGNGLVNTFPLQWICMQQRNGGLCMVVPRCYKEGTRLELGHLVCEEKTLLVARVLSWKGATVQRGRECRSWRISITRKHLITHWEHWCVCVCVCVCVCNSDLYSVQISNGTVINCNYKLWVKVVSKSNIQSKTPSSVTLNWDNIITV